MFVSLTKSRTVHQRLALILGLVAALSSSPAFGQEPGEAAYYYAYQGKVAVTIAGNQIGLLLHSEVPAPEVRSQLMRAAGSQEIEEYPGGIVILTLPTRLENAEFSVLPGRIADHASNTVARAGLVVRHEGTEEPMILARDFIVRFKTGISRRRITDFNREHRVEILTEDPYAENQFLLQITAGTERDALTTANLYHESELTEFAHPNFVRVVIDRQFIPDDPFFNNQWHHENDGASGGTIDADIDSPRAWDLTLGDPDVVVAVIDSGFDASHLDLTPNLWANPGETADGTDGDGNGRVDDVFGWDFRPCDAAPTLNCGDANVAGGDHGTAVAGLVAAEGDNARGVSGACPDCRVMLIRRAFSDFGQGLQFGYAQAEGADIITNSWGYAVGTACALNVCTAIDNAAAAGVMVLFAMNNGNVDDCIGTSPDISALDSVFAVSASSNQDRKVTESGFGNCMEILGPTHRGYSAPYAGTLNVATTDRVGVSGYNNLTTPSAPCPSTEPGDRDYTFCFGGTSAATPTTAGVAALALSADSTLERLQLHRLLQDTADKIQDSVAAYSTQTGFSSPASGHASHGWGRVNSFEAVRLVAPAADGGRGGHDVFIRDNRLDWGNTEQPSSVLFEPTRGVIPHWQSVDIKVDRPPYQPAPTTSAAFEAFADEAPKSGEINKIYVRVRNRGPEVVESVGVKLHWAFAGTALPALPADFWTAFPGDSATTTIWHPLGNQSIANLAYSGASVAGCPGRAQPPCGALVDNARIVRFDFPGPPLDLTRPQPRHYCLLAVLYSPDDPVSPASTTAFHPDWITPRDNNVTHRNLVLLDPDRDRDREVRFYVRNPTAIAQRTILELAVPEGWKTRVQGVDPGSSFTMQPGEEILVTLTLLPSSPQATGTVTARQVFPDATPFFSGGLTFDVAPRPDDGAAKKPAWSFHLGIADPQGTLGSFFDDGLAATFDVEFPLRPRWSWDLRLGLSTFDAGFGDLDDLEILDLSANLKYMLTAAGSWRPFVNGGLGVYYIDSNDIEGGYNLGVGLARRLGPQLTFEATFNHHETFTASPDIEFNKVQLGLIRRF